MKKKVPKAKPVAKTAAAKQAHVERVARMNSAAFQQLLGRGNAAGPDSRLEIREDDAHGLHFRVLGPATDAVAAEADLNEVWWCPPVC